MRQGFFGQQINLTTYNLCRINMFLHDVNYERFIGGDNEADTFRRDSRIIDLEGR